jgi:hypothetical protein
LVEDRMTFWKWTFLKYDKCPNLISSKKCFLGALKNLEENIEFIVALKMLRKIMISIQSWKNILENLGLFWTNIWTFLVLALLARLNIVIEPSQEI